MKRIHKTRWFRLLRQRARAVARRTGQTYPTNDSNIMRDVHAQAERELGAMLRRAVEVE